MSLWGTADAVYSTGTITVDYSNKAVIGSGTTFSSVSVGDVISIGVGNTYGEAVVSGITSDTYMTIKSTDHLSESVDGISGLAYTVSQKPVYTLFDNHYGSNDIYGVDNAEVDVARTTKYDVAHGGWVGIITYMDNSENPPVLRVKTEVLVAMGKDSDGSGGITSGTPQAGVPGDASDDNIFPDT